MTHDVKHEICCEGCESSRVKLIESEIEFQYGLGDDEVTLKAQVPLWVCDDCGVQYTGIGAELAQHDAVCEYLGRMRPSEIKEMRRRSGKSQTEFARELQVGEASLKRWESGSSVPSKALNRVLVDYQVREAAVRAEQVSQPMLRRKFRTNAVDGRVAAARNFRLRPSIYNSEAA